MAKLLLEQLELVTEKIRRLSGYASETDERSKRKFKVTFPSLVSWEQEFDRTYCEYSSKLKQTKSPDEETEAEIARVKKLSDEIQELICDIRVDYDCIFNGDNGSQSGSDKAKSELQSIQSMLSTRYMHHNLPKLNLPTFDGEKTKFMNFYDLFTQLVIKQDSLSDIERLQYLKLSLKGEAARLIANIPVKADSFDIAWTAITDEYYRPRVLRSVHLNALQDVQKVKQADGPALKSLLSTARENIAALKNLEVDVDSCGVILENMICRKLDSSTRRQWELTLDSDSKPTHVELIGFLAKQVSSLEVEPVKHLKSFEHGKPAKGHKPASRVMTLAADTSCPHCRKPHYIQHCTEFKALTPKGRQDAAIKHKICLNCLKPGHFYQNCTSKSTCRTCNRYHHTLLHFERSNNSFSPKRGKRSPKSSRSSSPKHDETAQGSSSNSDTTTTAARTYTLSQATKHTSVLLPTAKLHLFDSVGKVHTVRALLDTGSQNSYITHRCARNLNLSVKQCQTKIMSIGDTHVKDTSGIVHTKIKPCSRETPVLDLNCIVIDNITGKIPDKPISRDVIDQFGNIQLSDPECYKSQRIDMLLGADIWGQVIRNGVRKGAEGSLSAIKTVFGWVIMGEYTSKQASNAVVSYHVYTQEDTHDLLAKFWELENVPTPAFVAKPEDKIVEDNFVNTTHRDTEGKYTVTLPFKQYPPELGNSYKQALSICHAQLTRLSKEPELLQAYDAIFDEYLQKGYVTKLDIQPNLNDQDSYYIPHHAVVKPDSATTPVRIVFNASKPSSNGKSINDYLYPGPVLQKSIFTLHLRNRFYPILITGDLKQMFLQVRVVSEHQRFLRFVWKPADATHPVVYQFNTICFGLNCSPFLALRTVEQLAHDEGDRYPLAAQVLQNDVYMDDVVTGAEDVQSALTLRRELTDIFDKGGFTLRKWASNSQTLLDELPDEARAVHDVHFTDDESVKLLGVKWVCKSDCYEYTVSKPDELCTKRNILSCIARIYDPLGIMSPLVMYLKLIMQELWKSKIDWDEEPPTHIVAEWKLFLNEIDCISNYSLPRLACLGAKFELIGFADASERGYCAVIYVKSYANDKPVVHLLCAKTRVAPLKKITVPRLELCAAHLLAKLLENVLETIPKQPEAVHCFSDSMIVLAWLRKEPHALKTFVGNRVAQIQTKFPSEHWRHVASEHNAADVGSRGLSPLNFKICTLWINGPDWLQLPYSSWPQSEAVQLSEDQTDSVQTEVSKSLSLKTVQTCSFFNALSNYNRMIRTMAYCLRWRDISSGNRKGTDVFSPEELARAQAKVVLLAQAEGLQEELTKLRRGEVCRSSVKSLVPFIDTEGIIRVGGRLEHANMEYAQKHPILLPSQHPFTKALIKHYHEKHMHVGAQGLESILGRQFWILASRRTIRSVLKSCVHCFRFRPTVDYPLMGQLPKDRVNVAKPFLNSGVDYAGPYNISWSRRRGTSSHKAYICLFVCFATKAVHIELVTDMSTDTFLAALRRFVARRGRVANLYSDCGTNFVGANRKLTELQTILSSEEFNTQVASHVAQEGITWHFNPPSTPHFGGLWEAAVKSTKRLLSRVLTEKLLTYEEFSTLLTEVEAMLNSRPLFQKSSDPSDPAPLTPGHFLVTEPTVTLPSLDHTETPTNRLSSWEMISKLQQEFWSRWQQTYLRTLQERYKWNEQTNPLTIDTVVLVNDHPMPPTAWRLARIVNLIPGSDGINRVAILKTAKGEITRPVAKLCPLPTV